MYVLSQLRRAILGVVAALLLLGSVVGLTATAASASPVTALFEDFEDSTVAYTTTTPEFTDDFSDYFTRTDGTNINSSVSVSGFNGSSWFGAQDVDGEGASLPQSLVFSGIDISGLTDLEFSILLAEDDDGTNEDWDLSDSVIVTYAVDGGAAQPILAVESVPDGDDFNAVPAIDTDFDGDGDGTEITSTFASFAASIPETGSLLELTITINLNSGDEDIAIDDVTVVGQQATSGPADPVVNEIGYSDSSTDNEFVEIFGDADTDYSAYSFLQVDSDADAIGVIDSVVPVGSTDSNGLWVANVAANEFENGDTSFLLVEGFTGSDGDDLDTDDDGTFEVEPWTRIVDSVSVNDGGGVFFGVPVLDESFDDARLPANGFSPGGLSRIPDGADTDSAADWYRNDFDWDGATNGSPEVGEALNTPGAPNAVVSAPLPTVFISELHYDNDGADVGEFVEVTGDAGTDLSGWTLVFYNGNGGAPYTTENLSGVIDDEEAGQGAVSFAVSGIQNGSPDGVALVAPDGTVIEFLSYEGSFLAVGGAADGVTSSDIGVTESSGTPIGQSLQLIDGVWTGPAAESPGVLNSGDDPEPPAPTVTLISAIQGSGPSVAGYAAFLDDLAAKRIILDDDNNDQNDAIFDTTPDEAYPWPIGGFSTTNFFRGGDSISGMTGVMHWSFAGQSGTDAWRIRPVDGIDNVFAAENPRPAAPEAVGGTMTVASFNVLNYFTTIDENGNLCGPSNLGCRGADSAAELDRQRAKIVDALAKIDADVVGLIEIENDEGASAEDLVAALNAATAPGTYAALDTGAIGGDAIKVALLYKPGQVTPVGDFAILDASVDPTFVDDKNRPVLIQTFEENATGARVTVAVNHLKSKGSDCDALGDPNANDGQGNCNLTRADAAQALADYLATDPTQSGSDNILIIGDLNAYANEDPITRLEAAGYTDLLGELAGPDAYTFVFDGQLGYLDYILANEAVLPFVTGITAWNTNADEVNVLDYNDAVRDSTEASFERESSALETFSPDAFRSSDHDAVIVGLSLVDPEPVPTCNGLPATIVGTDRRDVIRGTAGADVIVALGGNDLVFGLGGDDTICGGDGADVLYGQNGDDLLLGEAGRDRLYGARGMDELVGGTDADRLFGGQQDDVLLGESGNDQLFGGANNDQLDGGEGRDRLFGQSGNDQLDGGPDRDVLTGNSGRDTCVNGERVRSCRVV